MRLLLLGCGYAGLALAREALDRGHRVAALTRNTVRLQELASLGVETVPGDLQATDWHARVPFEPEAIVNTVSSAGPGLEGYRTSYVEGQQSALAFASRIGGVRHFLYTSSTSVYPQGDGSVVTETSSTEGCGPSARILLEGERLVAESTVASHRSVLRLAGIYGPGRHHLLDQLRRGELTFAGGGDIWLNLIHRDDICSAVWSVLARAPEGFLLANACDGHPATKADVLSWLAARAGVGEPVFDRHLPPGPSARRTFGAGSVPHRRVSSEHLRAVTGWSPRHPTFREGYAGILA